VFELYRADDIKNVIKDGAYPYALAFFTQERLPEHRAFPFVEIVNVRPEGERKSFDVTEETNTFEVRVYVRYNRKQELETQDLYTVENEIIRLLKSATLSDSLEINSNFEWNRGDISNNKFKIHGIQSTLTVSITEKKSTSGDGVLGGHSTISIGDVTELQDVVVLSEPVSRNTETNVPYYNASRKLKGYAPVGGAKTRFYEIEYTVPIEAKLEELKESRGKLTLTEKRGDATKSFTALIGNIGIGTRSFDSLTTILVQFDVI